MKIAIRNSSAISLKCWAGKSCLDAFSEGDYIYIVEVVMNILNAIVVTYYSVNCILRVTNNTGFHIFFFPSYVCFLLPCVTKWKMYKWRKNCTLVSCLFLDFVSHFFSWHYIWAICLVFDLKTDIVVQRLILFIMIRYVTVYSLKRKLFISDF